MTELEILGRAHALFPGGRAPAAQALTGPGPRPPTGPPPGAGAGPAGYRRGAAGSATALLAAVETDARLGRVLAAALEEHAEARRRTGAVLAAARADRGAVGDSPAAQREAVLRRVARLRAQHAHVVAARAAARRRLLLLRALRYLVARGRIRLRGTGVPAPRGRVAGAVRAALSRLGRPYVWGAIGPDRFDCSGLVQWAYRQVGIDLPRTTYDQIGVGVAVPREAVRPGDLVFPHAGHVQLAIGNNLVVEAPYSGASVRISPLGGHVQIRRPV
ncbi:C40 family peptidase [Mycolicibacterium palauense]|uniref:C40 family peptidase n=1 Tax=Mycolicibacterium palauense TaxID=2034511 RepID=UPI000BFEFA38|nr:C40 family peptidase [Mycolicibacterium palauense]